MGILLTIFETSNEFYEQFISLTIENYAKIYPFYSGQYGEVPVLCMDSKTSLILRENGFEKWQNETWDGIKEIKIPYKVTDVIENQDETGFLNLIRWAAAKNSVKIKKLTSNYRRFWIFVVYKVCKNESLLSKSELQQLNATFGSILNDLYNSDYNLDAGINCPKIIKSNDTRLSILSTAEVLLVKKAIKHVLNHRSTDKALWDLILQSEECLSEILKNSNSKVPIWISVLF